MLFPLAYKDKIVYISLNNNKILFREMRFNNFKNQIKDFPVFSSAQFVAQADNKQLLRNQISMWKKQDLIIPLKKGLYVLNEHDRRITPSREFIANQLVFPSYISIEYALGFYNIIPERAFQVTSVTSKKTMRFENVFGTFTFRSIRNDLFFGFIPLKDENEMSFMIAEKEKAFLDFLYFNLSNIDVNDRTVLQESYRMENLDELNRYLILDYAERFRSKKLSRLVNNLINKG